MPISVTINDATKIRSSSKAITRETIVFKAKSLNRRLYLIHLANKSPQFCYPDQILPNQNSTDKEADNYEHNRQLNQRKA